MAVAIEAVLTNWAGVSGLWRRPVAPEPGVRGTLRQVCRRIRIRGRINVVGYGAVATRSLRQRVGEDSELIYDVDGAIRYNWCGQHLGTGN
jgi:hypothetical protein